MLTIENLITIIGYGTGIVTLIICITATLSEEYRKSAKEEWIRSKGGRILGIVTGIAAIIWPFIFGVLWLILALGRLAKVIIAFVLISKFADKLDDVPFDINDLRKN